MNVVPPAAPPAPRHDGGGRGDPTGDDASAFGQLLAGATADAAPPVAANADGGSDEAVDDHPGGEVAQAVHAAIAGWRADPTDVALGAHLREALQRVVGTAPTPGPGNGTGAVEAGAPDAGAPSTVAGTTTTAPVDPTVLATPGEHAVPADGEATPQPGPATAPATTATGAVAPTASPDHATPMAPAAPDAPPAGAPAEPATPAPAAVAATASRPGRPAPDRRPDGVDPAGPPTYRQEPVDAPAAPGEAAARVAEAGPATPRAGSTAPTSAATLDRVMRAVEVLEHAPPPRRLAVEVEGVQLSVALRGDEVRVAVRAGADQLPPGWARDLATALRDRGMGLAADTGPSGGQDRATRGGPGDREDLPPRPSPSSPSRTRRPASAGIRL